MFVYEKYGQARQRHIRKSNNNLLHILGYHCNRVVIVNLELVQFWLFLAAFRTPLTTDVIVSNKKKTQNIYLYSHQYLRYNII